ncbi:MAG: LamG-like jellyroll fold domain-containing protein [Phycisphaeraceae bacterium]
MSGSHALAIQVAGTLLVDLHASGGGGASWTNAGALGNFAEVGDVTTSTLGANSNAAVNLSGATYYTGPISPVGITGGGARTIEVWAFNPATAAEETMVAWGRRGGPDGSNMAFNYGNNGDFGAAGHWGGRDMGWDGSPATGAGAGAGAPATGQWHQLVYTYDGTAGRVYADGVLKNSDNFTLLTHAGFPILIGTQTAPSGVATEVGSSLSIGQVRVHDGALSAAQIVANFNEEAGAYGLAQRFADFSPIAAHRYSFNGDANDSIGGANLTLVNGASVVGGQLVLANNGTNNNAATGQYAELPDGLISGLDGNATFEAWIVRTADGNNWQRIIDFGGGTGEYLFVSPKAGIGGPEGEPALLELKDDSNAVGVQRAAAAEIPIGSLVQVVAVVDELSNQMRLYVDGTLVSTAGLAGFDLGNLNDTQNWLGRSQFADAFFAGNFEEFRIYNVALTDAQVLGNFLAGPNSPNTIPEPATGLLGLLAFAALGRRRRHAA